LPRHRVVSRIALVCVAALAAAAGGCSKLETNDGGWFSKPMDVFSKPDWARATGNTKATELGPTGPVKPEDLVGADGRCGAPSAEAAQATAPPPQPPADRPVGSVAGDLAGAPMPAGTSAAPDPGTPPVLGGIALGMTECQAVRRAGTPSNVSINGGDKGERNVVLTYLGGTWPGI
jgi:hypothetical protein